MISEEAVRNDICEIGRRIYARNFAAATDGNISVRVGEHRYLCTPSGVSKGFMQPEDIVVADGAGARIEGAGKVTSEFFTHLAAYEERADVLAVVHAHPPRATGLTLAGVRLDEPVLPELLLTLGGIPTAPYATPGTPDGADVIRDLIRRCDALMLDRHGAITVGRDVFEAFHKLEKLEHAAETLFTAHMVGSLRALPSEEVERLLRIQETYGAGARAYRPE